MKHQQVKDPDEILHNRSGRRFHGQPRAHRPAVDKKRLARRTEPPAAADAGPHTIRACRRRRARRYAFGSIVAALLPLWNAARKSLPAVPFSRRCIPFPVLNTG
jgi:hypothetical protein